MTFGSQFVGHEDAFHHNLVVQVLAGGKRSLQPDRPPNSRIHRFNTRVHPSNTRDILPQDWCAPNDGTCTANFTIGQVCNGTLDALPAPAPAVPRRQRTTPPLGSNITLGPLASLGGYVGLLVSHTRARRMRSPNQFDPLPPAQLRHCNFVVSATQPQVGLAQDYEFTIVPALNGNASALSFRVRFGGRSIRTGTCWRHLVSHAPLPSLLTTPTTSWLSTPRMRLDWGRLSSRLGQPRATLPGQ